MPENFPPVLEFNFRNDLHVMAYVTYLLAENLEYHFDDDPMEIDWQTRIVSVADQSHLSVNHSRLWAYCNPWEWFDRHPQMWAMWTGGSEISPQ